jgi:hypothetical protein
MAFPPEDLCITLPDIPTVDQICLPGGVCLDYVWDGINKIPHAADMPMDFFSQIGPAMTPLMPVFNILETVLALFRCVKAVPDALVKLDPSELIKCAPALVEAVDQLLKLIPQLSLPKMVIAIIKNIASLLRAIASDLSYVQSQIQRIADVIDRASDLQDYTLNGFMVCAQADLEKTTASTAAALRGIGSIVLIVNTIMGLFGGPEIPCFSDLLSVPVDQLDDAIDLLAKMAALLEDIANAIPDPDLVLTLALGEQSC